MFSIVSDTSDVNLQYTNLEAIQNLLLAHNSTFNIKNNIYDNDNINSLYTYNNSVIYIDKLILNKYRNIKGIKNNFVNFPNLSIYAADIDDIANNFTTINYYFKNNKFYFYHPNDILQFSPKFINNGFKEEWSNNNQYTRANIVLKLSEKTKQAWLDLVNLIKELPKNLNGKNLQIYFNIDLKSSDVEIIEAMKKNPLKFENFIGGTIQLFGNISSKLSISNNENVLFDSVYPLNICSSLQFVNCLAIDILNLKFGNDFTSLNLPILQFTNCKKINISNCVYTNKFTNENNIQINNSNLTVSNSYFNFNNLTYSYKGIVSNGSKVFISETVFIYKLGTLNKNNAYKKFKVDKNSFVTWINIYDSIDNLLENISGEFNVDTLTNGIANHKHSNLLFDIGLGDNITSGLISQLTMSIPVGTTFYWPRAFTISNLNETNLNKSLMTFPVDDVNYKNYFINGYTFNNMKIVHNIPFISGAVPLDNNGTVGADNKTWSQRWKKELDKLPSELKPFVNSFENTSTINSKLFKLPDTDANTFKFHFKTITPNNKNISADKVPNKIMHLAGVNFNCTGPSVRTERADRFGYLDYFPAYGTNGCGFSITAGATHNWGGENQSEYRILDYIDNRNPFYYLNNYEKFKSKIDNAVNTFYYAEIPPPHDEYWYARQGLHIIYHFGFTDENNNVILPEYLEYGYLKFSFNLIRNTNGLGNWYGTFMIADNYSIPYSSIHVSESSACGHKYPKEKYFPIVSFINDSKTVVKRVANKNRLYYYDPEDVPLYGNYFLMNSGDIYLPLNRIAGKFLIFGMRGTYSTNKTELDNGAYTGPYRGNSNPTQTCSTIKFSDFKIVPAILPYKNNDIETGKDKWNLANNSPLLLNNVKSKNKEDKITLAGFGTRYYTATSFLYRTTPTLEERMPLADLADFYADKTIVSDTVLCIKTQEKVELITPEISREDILATPESLYWYLIKNEKNNYTSKGLLSSLFYITNGSQTSLVGTSMEELKDNAKHRKLLYSDSANDNRSINMYQTTNFPCISYDKTYNYTNKVYGNNISNVESSESCPVLAVQTDFTLQNKSTQPNLNIDIYNYYFVENSKYTPSSFVDTSNNGRFEYFGAIKNPLPDEGPGGWIYNAGYCKHLLAKSMFDTINTQLNNINAYPYYFYSPIPGTNTISNAQQIKYNIGVLPDLTNSITSGDYLYDADGYASHEASTRDSTREHINTNNYPFGVYSKHIGLRRTKGLAWPLFEVITNDIDKTKLEDIGITSSFFSQATTEEYNNVLNTFKQGCITLDNSNKILTNKIYPNLNKTNYSKILFVNKPNICSPTVYNIPLVFNKSNIELFEIYNNNTLLNSSSYIDIIKYPIDLINHYSTDSYIFAEETKDYNIGFLNLDKLYNNISDFSKLKLCWSISQNLGNGLIFGYIQDKNLPLTEQKLIFDLTTWNGAYNTITEEEIVEKQKSFINTHEDKEIVVGIQFSSIESDIADLNNNIYNFNNSEGKVYNNNNHTLTISYLELGKYFGSIEYEYRGIKENSVINVDNKIWNYKQSYTFKNKSDFILFYYFYKHLTNFYLIKFNKIWNNILLLKNNNKIRNIS